jgi:2-polyprenyl-3-methyl-5-hydroxy-6-metoxy-1,4-benzoquinol methylase
MRRALNSGGFLRKPTQGKYDMACTAATDPYTSCGFSKVICISDIKDFLIHHLSNRYAGIQGISLEEFEAQINSLILGYRSKNLKSAFPTTETKILRGRWSKSYYEQPIDSIFSLIPNETRTILSIGCGWGATEIKLKMKGLAVTAIPLDSIIGASAERLGIDIVYGDINEAFVKILPTKFDAVMITNLIHLLPNADMLIGKCTEFVGSKGYLLLNGPNFQYLPHFLMRITRQGEYRKLSSYSESGINIISIPKIKKILKKRGFAIVKSKYELCLLNSGKYINSYPNIGNYLAKKWTMLAKKYT